MSVGLLIAAGVVANLTAGVAGAAKSLELDEKALKKYAKAFEKQSEANDRLYKKQKMAENRVANCMKKKKAILETTMKEFLEVYGKIQKIEFQDGSGIKELKQNKFSVEEVQQLDQMIMITKKPITDKEAVLGLTFNLYGSFVKDSERYLSAANNQMRSANVMDEQSNVIYMAYDNVILRADHIADLLVKMNFLLRKILVQAGKVIQNNGLDVAQYSQSDIEVLFICVNFADAVKKILDIPVIDEEDKMNQIAEKAIEAGNQVCAEFNKVIMMYT